MQHALCNMRVRRDRRSLSLRDKGRSAHPPDHRSLDPKHAVREGLLALAEDKRPEANTAHNF